jgi:hypothetical protein
MYTYIAGDNDLSDYALLDVTEMEETGGTNHRHVAVQLDTAGEHDGSVRYEIGEPDFEGRSHRTVIARLPEQNTGDPKYLASFASWSASRYPGKNRLLVVWNHGAGFMHEPTRDIGYDDSSGGDALTMGELRWALEKAGFGNGRHGKLSILGFDACLMNMLEVAYEFTGITELVVGSQQTEPGDGWPYGDVVGCLGRTTSPAAAAAKIVDSYLAYYRRVGTSGVTQSSIEVGALNGVGKAVDALATALLNVMDTSRNLITEARVKTQGYEEPTYVDMVDLMTNLSKKVPSAKVKTACAAVIKAVGKAVCSNGSYGRSVRRSCGLSIWFPLLKTDYVVRRNEYVALRYTRDYGNWAEFLDRLLAV